MKLFAAYGTGQLPDKEGNKCITPLEDNSYLIPTAEVLVTTFTRDTIFKRIRSSTEDDGMVTLF